MASLEVIDVDEVVAERENYIDDTQHELLASTQNEVHSCRRTWRRWACFCFLAAASLAATRAEKHGREEGLTSQQHQGAANRFLEEREGDIPVETDSPQTILSEDEAKELLDFAIVGFPKTGTSFMEHYLFNEDGETYIDSREHCLSKPDALQELDELVKDRGFQIGAKTKDGVRIKNAIKCPHEIYGEWDLRNYEKYYPEMKFIVSTRHPVLWFQSFFNFKLRRINKRTHGKDIWAPPTTDLMGPCALDTPYRYGAPHENKIQDHHNVCTDGAKFHHGLSRFGKTSMKSENELDLLGHHNMSIHSFPRAKIFIMELGQFGVEDQNLADQFLLDMKTFLGLRHDLPPLLHHESQTIKDELKEYVIDICDEDHDVVRAELVKTGRDAYMWIRDYFLKSPDVVVSNRAHFLELIEKWQYDPCEIEGGALIQKRQNEKRSYLLLIGMCLTVCFLCRYIARVSNLIE